MKVRQIISQPKIKVLQSKGMGQLARKYLKKGKEMARKTERTLVLLQLLELEIVSYKDEGGQLDASRDSLLELWKVEQELMLQQSFTSKSRYHTIDFLMISRNRVGSLNKDDQKRYDSVINDLESTYTPAFGREPLIYLHNLKGMREFNRGEFDKSYDHFIDTVSTIESPPGIGSFHKEYFFALNNILVTSVLTKNYDSYKIHLSKIKTVFGPQKKFQADLFSTTMMYEIGLYAELGYYDKVLENESQIIRDIAQFKVNRVNRQIFFFNLALAAFGVNDFSKANRHIIEVLTDTPSKRINSSSNVYFYANFISLMILLERGEFDFLLYSVKSVQKQISKIRELNSFDKLIMKFLKNIASKPEERKALTAQLFEEDVFKNSKESTFAHQFFDFKCWIRAYQNNCSMQIVKQMDRKIEL